MALRVVLDADGVFLCERPYWRTALATALAVLGVDGLPRETFRALDRELFDVRSAQQHVKAIGINSNWYLSGALVGCAREELVRRDLSESLSRGDVNAAADCWSAALAAYAESLVHRSDGSGSPVDWLDQQTWFGPVIPRFQDIFHERDRRFDITPRHQVLGDVQAKRETFSRLLRSGVRVCICTGRGQNEVREPIRQFELTDESHIDTLVTHDEVAAAEQATGQAALSKPHWFPLAAAVVGFEPALEALKNGGSLRAPDGERAVFAGDGMADFRSTANARSRGLDVDFVLVTSAALSKDRVDEIRAAEFTIGVIPQFEALPDLFAETVR
jgi:phosphoglycolate phosphatase-like HAD superfamily hydrolase